MGVSTGMARLFLVLAVSMWGLVFIGVHEVLPHLTPVGLVTVRFGLIAVTLAALSAPRYGVLRRYRRGDRWLVVASGLAAVPATNLAIVNAQQYIAPALAALIMTSSPAIASVLVGPLLGERLTMRRRIGFVVALAGAAIVILTGSGEGSPLVSRNPWGAATALIAATCWALYTLAQKRLAEKGYPPVHAVSASLLIGGASLVVLLPWVAPQLPGLEVPTWGWLVFMAFGGSLIPYFMWSAALHRLDASQAVAYMYLVPLFALMWSALILGNVPRLQSLAGGLVVIVGVALTQQFRARQPVEPVPAP
jgi:drug/metabolite transporter (DMT)-like permease